ncbi:MAG TPA: ATP-binding protein [Polyangiaceae bacterium]|nr:ATP-binding protein [Polyangiaceae bacterium]
MLTQFLAGVLFAWVLSYIGIGLSFCITYLVHRREPEHLVFGLNSLAMAIHAVGLMLAYAHGGEADTRFAVVMTMFGTILGSALVVHFALLFAKVQAPMRWMRFVYATAAAFALANAWGLLIDLKSPEPVAMRLGSIVVEHLDLVATPLGSGACAAVALASTASLGILLHATLGGRRDGIIPLLGAACMSGTTIHDALLALGIGGGTWLSPFGNAAFVFGVASAFLVRSSVLSKELTDQSLELKRRSGELRQSYEELREAQRELTRKEQLAAVGELAAVIAHEVRNPLAIISNAVAGLRRRETAAQDRETLLTILKEESSRLNRLVGDLLRYARPVNVQRQLVSVRDIIERTLTSTGLRDKMPVEIHEDGEIHSIWGDPGLLRQVFDNLIENAVQAMGGTGDSSVGSYPRVRTLSISMRSGHREALEGIHIDVQDTGEGMDPHVRVRAKDPFFTTRPSGTGLGLAIVDRIVEAHDGEISITSRTGAGTTVSVFLPIGAPLPPSSGALLVARDDRELARRAVPERR